MLISGIVLLLKEHISKDSTESSDTSFPTDSTFTELQDLMYASSTPSSTSITNRFGFGNNEKDNIKEDALNGIIHGSVEFKRGGPKLPGKPMFNNNANLPLKLSSTLKNKIDYHDNKNMDRNNFSLLPNMNNEYSITKSSEVKTENIQGLNFKPEASTDEIPRRPNFKTDKKKSSSDLIIGQMVTNTEQTTERPTTIEAYLPQLTRLMEFSKNSKRDGYPQLHSERRQYTLPVEVTTRSSIKTTPLSITTTKSVDYLDKVYNQLNTAIKTLSEMQNDESGRHLDIPKANSNLDYFKDGRFNPVNVQNPTDYFKSGYNRLRNKYSQNELQESILSRPQNIGQPETKIGSNNDPNMHSDFIKELFGHNIPAGNSFQQDALRNALIQQLRRRKVSGVGVKSPTSFDDWKSSSSGFIRSDGKVPSSLPPRRFVTNRQSNSFGNVRNSGFSNQKTGASRLKLPPVISSTFNFNPPEEMVQEEIPSITSFGPVNIPNALRRYGNLNELATIQSTNNRVTDIEIERLADIGDDRMHMMSKYPEMTYNRPDNKENSYPHDQRRNTLSTFQVGNTRRNSQRVSPTMHPVYNTDYDHIRGLFVPQGAPRPSGYSNYYGNNPRSGYKRLVSNSLKHPAGTKYKSKVVLDTNTENGNRATDPFQRNGENLIVLTPQYIPPPSLDISTSLRKVEDKEQGLETRRILLKKILKDYYSRKISKAQSRKKRSIERMLRPPTAWLKYYSNGTNNNNNNSMESDESSSKVKPIQYSSFDATMMNDYYYQMMMANNSSQSSTEVPTSNQNEEVDSVKETENLNVELAPPELNQNSEETKLLLPVPETTATSLALSKPEAIKKAELSAAEVNKLNTNSIQSLVAQASILGEGAVNSLSVSSSLSFNKLIIAAILSLIPTIAIAIPFLAPNLTRRTRRRRRYYVLY